MIKEYVSFFDMINDNNLVEGDICKTLSRSIIGDNGGGEWNIKLSEKSDNLIAFSMNNKKLMAEYCFVNDIWINVKALGVVSDSDSELIRRNNAYILKSLILKYNNTKHFYFPIGKYYFNEIDIDDIGNYEIILYGEKGGNENSAYIEATNVTIYTPECGFINRTTISGDNTTRFSVENISFIGASFYDKKPTSICLGTTINNGGEYNFIFKNVHFYGYEYGFKSPGYTCGSSRGYRVTFEHCIYGMYIGSSSHNFILDTIDILYCKYGIRMSVGGNPCKISNVHVAVGCFKGIDLSNNSKMYAIHSKGGLVIEGMYYEQYSGELDVSNYTLIDYEGWGMGNVGKVIIKDVPIGNMGADNKGYFFTGSTFIGEGTETGKDNLMQLDGQMRNEYFSDGCVEFINCISTGGLDEIKSRIKSSFNIIGGLSNAFGFTFDNFELFGEGFTFTKKYKRRFSSYLTNGTFNSKNLFNLYNTLSIPSENRIWNGLEFPHNPVTDNSENTRGTEYKGVITINRIENKYTNVTLGIIGVVDDKYIMVRELATLDSSCCNKLIKI